MIDIGIFYMRPNFNFIVLFLAGVCFLSMQGCTQHHALEHPENPTAKFYGNKNELGDNVPHLEAPKVYASDLNCDDQHDNFAPLNYRVDLPAKFLNTAYASAPKSLSNRIFERYMPLSPGDLIELLIEDGEGFSGRYVVDANGYLNVPLLDPIPAQGLGIRQLSEKVEFGLVRREIFRPDTISVHTQILHLAEIEVSVSGAVFAPGRVRMNSKTQSQVIEDRVKAFGDHSSKRMLSEAVRAASGIRPDAKLDQVLLVRNGWQVEVDLSGILTGDPVNDIPLIMHDRVIVPSTGCFQPHLVRPSQITPKGFRAFFSNLTDSAESNSSAAVGRYSTNIPYGTRLLQAAVSANCVGGKQWTNAPRKVVLASSNPLTGQFQVVERSVEELMRQAHRDEINPYVMPNDAIACYDSDVSNVRDIAKTLSDIIQPLKLVL